MTCGRDDKRPGANLLGSSTEPHPYPDARQAKGMPLRFSVARDIKRNGPSSGEAEAALGLPPPAAAVTLGRLSYLARGSNRAGHMPATVAGPAAGDLLGAAVGFRRWQGNEAQS
jgi:hypothetical protein